MFNFRGKIKNVIFQNEDENNLRETSVCRRSVCGGPLQPLHRFYLQSAVASCTLAYDKVTSK